MLVKTIHQDASKHQFFFKCLKNVLCNARVPYYVRSTVSLDCVCVSHAGEEHYNCISALHKSMRGSEPNAALYWLARMLEGGEDPLYVGRRLVRFASEDIGKQPVLFSSAY